MDGEKSDISITWGVILKSMKIIVSGCNGKMGKSVVELANKSQVHEIVAGIDKNTESDGLFPIYHSIENLGIEADVLIDFSHPSALNSILEYCIKNNIPAVICTTGLSENQIINLKEASKQIPIFYSRNMSLGINLLINLARKATEFLGENFDIEIVEKHHNQKIDAPSGTALMIAEEISENLEEKPQYIYDRTQNRNSRDKNEIGIHSIRAGSICGDHEVIFAGKNEIITISHHAQSREVFADGALRAAEFLINRDAGLYDMKDMISNK